MPNRTIPVLASLAGVLTLCYLCLVVLTVSHAAWQTSLGVAVQETEAELAALESAYYDAVAVIDTTHPSALGLTEPAGVSYASAASAPSVTLR